MTVPSPDSLQGSSFARLARDSGAFAMLAIDQRETLRSLLAEAFDGPVGDEEVVRFKVEVTRSLSPFASAVLIDTQYGLDAMSQDGARAAGSGLIVAADHFEQEPGRPVDRVTLDLEAARRAVDAGADALKLLVPWRRGEEVDERARLVEGFLNECRRHRLLAIVEGVVREPRGSTEPVAPADHPELVLEAAAELTAFGPDIYKAEVPTLGTAPAEEIEVHARHVTDVVARPWVVLSAGVAGERFEAAVGAACRGGASGFLAGRGIWRAALDPSIRQQGLDEVALPRLRRLLATVDASARPWWEARSLGAPKQPNGAPS